MNTGTLTFSDVISYIIPVVISAVTSAVVSIISFLFTRHYVVSGSRRRIIRAIFNNVKVKDENKSLSLRRLYEDISVLKLAQLIVYIYIFILLSSFPYLKLISFAGYPYFILLLLIVYLFLYIPFARISNKLILLAYKKSYKNSEKIINVIKKTLNSYNENLQSLISYIFYSIYIIWVYRLYSNSEWLSAILLIFLPPVVLELILSTIPQSRLEYKTDLESLIFMNSGVTIKARVHTSNDTIEGIITDIRDELVLSEEHKKIYITWDNILYFEIIEEEGKNNGANESTIKSDFL